MSPDQKAQLVTSLMDIGYGNKVAYTCSLVSMLVISLAVLIHRYGVAMCGDGANDCGVSL